MASEGLLGDELPRLERKMAAGVCGTCLAFRFEVGSSQLPSKQKAAVGIDT